MDIKKAMRDMRRVSKLQKYIKEKTELFSREPVNQRDSGFLEALAQVKYIIDETE